MNVLVINAGSSSLKYQLVSSDEETVWAKGIVERIGSGNASLTHESYMKQGINLEREVLDHAQAVKLVLKVLLDSKHGAVSCIEEIDAIGHRVVHGGEKFCNAMLLSKSVMEVLKENIELAPLHNPANIMGIEACAEVMPDKQMVAVFDTAYHQTMPPKAFMYAIPMDAYAKYKIRRYGFHGTSHHYVANRACKILNREKKTLRIITCHLGNGSSIAAIKQGKVIDTSMGFTPLEGVAMGTRCGDIDPTVVQYLMEKTNMSVDQTIEYLNHKSGVLGISGISSDFRDLLKAADLGDANAKLAIEIFCYRVKKNIGAYIAALGGVDVIVFTAGIGENATKVRQMIISDMEYLGIKLDAQKNNVRRQEIIISEDSSKVTVMVVPTNEELMIARETCVICRKLQEKQSAASV